MYREGTICPGTERYARGRNEGRNGMERGETRGGTERYGTKSVKIPMRTLYILIE
jgi:hypothetical protein